MTISTSVYTGLRAGEKLFEELFHDEERLSATGSDKILLARSRQMPWDVLQASLERMESACATFDEVKLHALLAELVPEYRPGATLGDDGPRQASNVIQLSRTTRREDS